ncbi:MAG: hypothetical protein ACFE8M_12175, partial [Candidatus Hermodarchaeota archaeon]
PVYDTWGIGNRTALIRVPGYEKSARIEYRAGDAAMNIYLGIALLLAAGLNGIKNKIEPKNPINTNIDRLTAEERVKLGVRELPRSLDQSLTAFEKSNFIEKVLGKELKKLFQNLKQKELNEFKKAKNDGKETSWELKKYLLC